MSETDLKLAIRKRLEAHGFVVVRVQAGKVKVRGGWMQLAPKGTPDLVVVAPYCWLEVKLPGEERSDDQVAWHEWAEANGVPVATVESPGQAQAVMLERRAEAEHAKAMGWR